MKIKMILPAHDGFYQPFYSWGNIIKASAQHNSVKHIIKLFTYVGGWKKFEPLWNFIIKTQGLNKMLPLLEAILSKVGSRPNHKQPLSPFLAIA